MSRQVELEISGMSCDNCVRHVKEALEAVRGVQAATVDLKEAVATVQVEPRVITEHLIEAIEEAGYQARLAGH
jgi:copper chaperone CopZ